MKSSLILAALVAVGLTACGSSPVTSYYTLMPPAAMGAGATAAPSSLPSTSTSASAATPSSPFVIEVQPVGVPESLDQPQIVIRKSGSGVAVLEHERWSAPLSEELRAALSSQLSRQLGTQDVAGLSLAAGQPVLRIKVQVRRFDAWPGERVNLEADWSIVQSNDTKLRLSCRTALAEQAPGGYDGMVSAQQRMLSQLSQAIATMASQWPQPNCPAVAPGAAAT